jgi:acyl carrier protein|tara:strand:- start:4559 stop:4810 length:252 start_codon:yes stop_codon:yes gene_type:complete
MSDIGNKVIEIIREALRVEDDVVIVPETSIIMELDGDSLDVIEVVIDIEAEYEIDILEEELAAVMLVGDLITIVEKAYAEQRG